MTMFEGRGEESGMADDFPMEDIQETPQDVIHDQERGPFDMFGIFFS